MKGRKLLMIPGPIQVKPPDVLAAMSVPTDSHISPDFIERYGHSLDLLKEVFLAPVGQPFVVAGSGTLAMDMAVVNLVEPGDEPPGGQFRLFRCPLPGPLQPLWCPGRHCFSTGR